jgi:hypothetical protein
MEVKMKIKSNSILLRLCLLICLFLSGYLLSACGPTAEVEAAPQPTDNLSIEPEMDPTPIVEIKTEQVTPRYTDAEYQLSFNYPPDWSLTVSQIGEPEMNSHPASHLVELVKEKYRALIHIKYYWDDTVIGGGMPPGDVRQDASINLFGKSIDRNRLDYQGFTKLVWYSGRFNDLELYIRLEDSNQDNYESIAIQDSLVAEVEGILAGFVRTGEPVTPPQPTPTVQNESEVCNLPTRLTDGDWATVLPGLPNVMRSLPGRGQDSQIIGQIPEGSIVKILDGPTCADGYFWWKVDAGLVSGWTAEGGDGVYWLSRVSNDEAVSVDGWVGTIISTPEWPQIDDYFQMLDQGGSRYGITSLDLTTRQQLEAYRDTGTLLRIWGKLFYGRVDAFNAQIEVTRFEVYQPANDQSGQVVEDWWGVIVSNPPGAQFDDYFQRMDQNDTRYGIDSLDPDIKQRLVELRDSGQIIRIWGVVNIDVPDAYGRQIQVTKLELAP